MTYPVTTRKTGYTAHHVNPESRKPQEASAGSVPAQRLTPFSVFQNANTLIMYRTMKFWFTSIMSSDTDRSLSIKITHEQRAKTVRRLFDGIEFLFSFPINAGSIPERPAE